MSDNSLLATLVDSLTPEDVAQTIADIKLRHALSAIRSGALDEATAHLSSIETELLDSPR